MATIETAVTKLFNIKHPILLAGMNVAAGPSLAAAVTNAGGMGVIGGVGYTVNMLRKQIQFLKAELQDKNVGGSARKTNYDYTGGQLAELIDVIIEERAKLFVSAVGVPPRWAVDKLHAAGIFVMNMIGAPKHARKALEVGVDLICAQGTEGGGHTGGIATSVLLPMVVDLCKGRKSPLTGGPVLVVAAGGIFDGRGLAMALSFGAEAVWVGTRFVATKEAGASDYHKQAVVNAGEDDTVRTIIYTGRPMRVLKTPFVMEWENNRQEEIKTLTAEGVIPIKHMEEQVKRGERAPPPPEQMAHVRPWLMGQAAAAIKDIPTAAEVMEEMVNSAAAILERDAARVRRAKL